MFILVGGFNPSVGMMTFPIYGRKMFQTTNQYTIFLRMKMHLPDIFWVNTRMPGDIPCDLDGDDLSLVQ